jgi:hypothetical protein
MHRRAISKVRLPLFLALLLSVAGAGAQQVWVGHGYTFEKPDSADWTLPEFHDSITANVELARQDIRGMFNLAQEDSFDRDNHSPVDTEWAYGRSADWEILTFNHWVMWAGGSPQGTIGQNAVLHLITDDIYIDIRFLGFSGGDSGGGFSYIRATPDTPVEPATLSKIKALY